MEMIEYLLERGSDTEFQFNWRSDFWPGFPGSKGTTIDFIFAIQKSHPNFFLLSEVSNFILILYFNNFCFVNFKILYHTTGFPSCGAKRNESGCEGSFY
jgi:hypothetical protein